MPIDIRARRSGVTADRAPTQRAYVRMLQRASLTTVAARREDRAMTTRLRRAAVAVLVVVVSLSLVESASGGTFGDFDRSLSYGSVEAIPNPAVVDTQPLRSQSLAVREAFVERVLACGYVDRVLDALTVTGAITTIDDDNGAFAVGAGGVDRG